MGHGDKTDGTKTREELEREIKQMTELNFEQDMAIDESALDVEWLNQPSLLIKYARKAIEARAKFDRAKLALDIAKAELDSAIRKNPEQYKINKITEAVVTNTILQEKDYQAAYEKMIEAKNESELMSRAVQAVSDRKTALENLVRLHGQQYFAGPSVPRDLSFEAQKKLGEQSSNNKVKSKMKRKRTKSSD